MKRRSLLDGYNSSSITKQSRRSLLDGYVPEEQLNTQVQELPQVANTAPVVSNQPTISAPQKMSIVDKIKSAGKVALADHLNKEIQKRELWEQNHPVLSALQKEYDTTYASRQNNRQFLLDKLNGLNPNAQEVAKKNLKQSVRPVANAGVDTALLLAAPEAVVGKLGAKAIQAASIANKANTAKRLATATNALKKANFAKEASQIATIGGIGGATHGLTEEADKIINDNKKLSTDLITKPLLYGTAGALTGPTFAGGNLVKNEIMRKIAPAIANNPVAKVIAEGIVGMGSATADAAVLGALEYPLGVPQEQKDAGYEMIDHITNYVKSPIPFMGSLNAVAPASEAVVNAIRDKASKIKGGANPKLQEALTKLNKRSKDSLDMKQTESIAEAQKLSADESQDKAIEFYTGKKAKDIKDAQEKANQETYEQHLQETYDVRPKTIPAEKIKTASGKTLNLPEIKVSPKQPEYIPVKKEITFRKPSKVNKSAEPTISSENVSTGINTPKKDLTHVNEPSGNRREKITKLPAVDKVAEGGHDIYKQTADNIDIYNKSKNSAIYDDGLTVSEAQDTVAKKYAVDDADFINFWEEYKGLYENGKPTMSSKAFMASKLWELNNSRTKLKSFRENVRKQQEYEKRLSEPRKVGDEISSYDELSAEKDMLGADLKGKKDVVEENKGYSQKEKDWASSQWRNILKKKGSEKQQAIANENKKRLAVKEVYNKDLYISGRLNQNKSKQQTSYDNLYEKIVNQQDVSPRVKELMVKQLNDNAKKFPEIKTQKYSVKEATNELRKELSSLNSSGNTFEAGKLIAKNKTLRKTKEAREHWEQSAALHSENIDNLIKEGKYKEAKEELAKYKRIIKNDIRNSVTKDRWASREVAKGTKPTELDDGRYTKISTDAQGRTWEYGPTGETYDFTPAGEGERLANERIAKWEAQISKGLNKKNNTVNYIKKDLNLASDYINKGKTFSADLRGKIKIKDLAIKNKVFEKLVSSKKGNIEVKFTGTKELNGASAGFDFHDGIIYLNKNEYNEGTIVHELQHVVDFSDEHIALFKQAAELGDKLKKFNADNTERINKIQEKVNRKQPLTPEEKSFATKANDMYNDYANHIIERRASQSEKGNPPATTLEEDLTLIKENNPEEWRKYNYEETFVRNNSRSKGSEGKHREIPEPTQGKWNSSTGRTVNSIRRQEGLSVQDKETLKKAKFSDRQIKELQKISAQNEKDAISLGILDTEQASKRKAALGKDIKWYAPQKHNPLRGEKVTKEPDYWNDSKVGLFGDAKKEAKETVTYADIVQNTYARQTKIKALKEVNKIIKNTSKAIGKKGVEKGYVAVNQKMLNSLIYNNNTYDFFKLLTDADNLSKLDDIKKTLMKDMTEEQADWFVKLAKKNSTPDYQIPEEVLKQALSFSKELASEQFHRYFQLPKSLGKQGSLKFLGSASLAVYEIGRAHV